MNLALAGALAESGEKGRPLPVEPWAVGVGAFVLLILLLLLTLSFGKDR